MTATSLFWIAALVMAIGVVLLRVASKTAGLVVLVIGLFVLISGRTQWRRRNQ